MKTCLIIPTLNEKNNVTKILEKIHKTKTKLDIIFIDDNSTDGTFEKVKKTLLKPIQNLLKTFKKQVCKT